jgi:hypothetical protein
LACREATLFVNGYVGIITPNRLDKPAGLSAISKNRSFAVADPGYTDLPGTTHFTFEFDNALNTVAATAFGAALAANAEDDFNLVSSWFDRLIPSGVPFNVKINKTSSTHSGSNDGNKQITIDLGASTDFALGRAVLVEEFIEIFEGAQGKGWIANQSHGEALSQVAGFTIVPEEAVRFIGPQTWLDTSVPPPPPTPPPPSRPDFVSNTGPTDTNAVSYGCGVLFLYYLRSQLGFSMRAIVQAAANTLEGVYHNLTQDSAVFNTFADLLASKFPPGIPSGLTGSTNPFPIPSSHSLSLRRFLTAHPLGGGSIKDLISSKNIGELRAVLNSDRPASLLS